MWVGIDDLPPGCKLSRVESWQRTLERLRELRVPFQGGTGEERFNLFKASYEAGLSGSGLIGYFVFLEGDQIGCFSMWDALVGAF